MTKDELIVLLERALAALRADDSFQGSIAYEIRPGGAFNVSAAIRVGNSMGQGGMMVVQEWEEEPAGGACPHANTQPVFDATACNDCGAFL